MDKRKCILIVDDVIINLQYAQHVLRDSFDTILASSGAEALQILENTTPDLVLLDIKMPDMDGYETIQRIKDNPNTAKIPVIFLTAETKTESELKGFELGALDYIHKPFSIPVMLSRINTQLELCSYRNNLEELVAKKTSALEHFQDVMSTCIAELIESRDGTTGFHIRNTTKYFTIFVNELSTREKYKNQFTEKYKTDLFRGASLHDIGKVGINDRVLRKPGTLNHDEFEYMKSHAKIGGVAFNNMLSRIKELSGDDIIPSGQDARNTELGFLYAAKDMALYHHEKWDGTGYPDGLKGEQIPLSARILAIADVYDALTAKRPYKETFSHEKSMEIIIDGRGTFFDPELTDIFVELSDQLKKCLFENQTTALPQYLNLYPDYQDKIV